MKVQEELLDRFYENLDERSRASLDEAVEKVVAAKMAGGKIVVATGSGPNIQRGDHPHSRTHGQGVDGVTTSRVIGHEMGGASTGSRCAALGPGARRNPQRRGRLRIHSAVAGQLTSSGGR